MKQCYKQSRIDNQLSQSKLKNSYLLISQRDETIRKGRVIIQKDGITSVFNKEKPQINEIDSLKFIQFKRELNIFQNKLFDQIKDRLQMNQISPSLKATLIGVQILTGAINTLGNSLIDSVYQFQNKQYVYEGPYYKYFFHPFIQTATIFLGEFLVLFAYFFFKFYIPQRFKTEKIKAEENGKEINMNNIFENKQRKPERNAEQILDSLKVLINQISCDDSKRFTTQIQQFKMLKAKDSILKYSYFKQQQYICKPTVGCQQTCVLCFFKFSSKDHNHDQKAETIQVQIYNKQANRKQRALRKMHLCNNEHKCESNCSQRGICSFTYENKTKTWIKHGMERNQQYKQQIQVRKPCSKPIPAGKYKHQKGQCSCNSQTHTCQQRCPDCGSLCYYIMYHEGKHKTYHSNQKHVIYPASQLNKQIKVLVDKPGQISEDYIFNVDNNALPMKCHISCQMKGRSHYHLLICKEGEGCLQKNKRYNAGAKHSHIKYYPHTNMIWFFVKFSGKQIILRCLCKSLNLTYVDSPAKDNIKAQKPPFYCTKNAWHSFSNFYSQHTFECAKMHKPTNFSGIEICFLIDITGSMSRFVEQCKTTIKSIVFRATQSKKIQNIKFSVVGYRDHEMSKSKISIKLKQLCISKKRQLQKQVKPFLNQRLQQMEYVKYLQQLQKKYQQKRSFENLQQQFNQKQLFILKYHYPFYLDISECSDDLVGVKQLIKFLNPLGLLLALLSSNPEQNGKTLKQLLLNNLSESLEEMQQEQKSEAQNKEKLKILEVSDFSDNTEAIKFLDKLEAAGGGDPPQAVLDGMDAVCHLKWSKDSDILKYVFHLFDAPPHGRIYGQDNRDRYPNGCPCGKKHEAIIQKINKIENLKYFIFPLTPRVISAMQLFSESGLKFEKKQLDKNSPQQFTNEITQKILKQLQSEQMIAYMQKI